MTSYLRTGLVTLGEGGRQIVENGRGKRRGLRDSRAKSVADLCKDWRDEDQHSFPLSCEAKKESVKEG